MKRILNTLILVGFFATSTAAQTAGVPVQGEMSPVQPQMANVPAGLSSTALIQTGGVQNPLLRGVPSGPASPEVLPLSIKDAVDRGLRYNLGIALGAQNIRAAQSSRLRTLSMLLPHVSAETTETAEQVNLASFGFSGLPGVPAIVGPFSVFDVRAFYSQPLLNLSRLSQLRAGSELVRASEHAFKNTRDLVVLVCLQLYMQVVTAGSRVDASQAQLKTAQTLYDLAVNRHNAGFVPGIEVLRAHVQMQAQQQRLIVAQNDFAKQKLNLAQAIGLPLGQQFQLTDQLPYVPLAAVTQESALQDAYRNRGDYLSALAQVKAAEDARQAAVRLKLPSADVNANYGDIGQRPWKSHGTFLVQVSLTIPIFTGRETESRILAAEAQLAQQNADLESLRARIYYEIDTALLDLKSTEDRVLVARNNVDLANQQVTQARDRFAAGVASNIEVVQAQDALALATEDFISSVYAHNIAKANLAEAMGMAESHYEKFLPGK